MARAIIFTFPVLTVFIFFLLLSEDLGVALVYALLMGGLLSYLADWLYRTLRWPIAPVNRVRPKVPDYGVDQPWRGPTDIRFIETLKIQLQFRENQGQDFATVFSEKQKTLGKWFWLFKLVHPSRFSVANSANPDDNRALCAAIDRLWGGNVFLELNNLRLEIQKTQRQRQDTTGVENHAAALFLDEQIIERERDIKDLEELQRRAKEHPYKVKFEDSKTKRTFDYKSTLFDIFEGPYKQDVEIQKMYNQAVTEVQGDPKLTSVQRAEIIERFERRMKQYNEKDRPKSPFGTSGTYRPS